MRKLRIFNSWLQKLLMGTAEINMCSRILPDLTYRVTRGSGMGLLHSGEVSDAGFWIAAERWLLNTSV